MTRNLPAVIYEFAHAKEQWDWDCAEDDGEQEDIFSPEFAAQLDNIKLPATKLEVLVKLLRRSIREYKKTKEAFDEAQEMLQDKDLKDLAQMQMDEAREKFKNIDLTDIESFMPHIKKIVKDIIHIQHLLHI